MNRITLAALAGAAVLFAGPAIAQQPVDWDKIQIKTTDLGNDGIIMLDTQFAPLSEKIMAAIKAISPLPIKYTILTHFHGDHTGGLANFQKAGVIGLAQDNIRIRLIAGTTNGTTGNKMAPQSGDAIPKETFIGGQKTIEVGGRKAVITHIYNAHTDGDT